MVLRAPTQAASATLRHRRLGVGDVVTVPISARRVVAQVGPVDADRSPVTQLIARLETALVASRSAVVPLRRDPRPLGVATVPPARDNWSQRLTGSGRTAPDRWVDRPVTGRAL